MMMHSIQRKAEPTPTAPSAGMGSVRHARTKQSHIGRATPSPTITPASVSTPIAKIATVSSQPAAHTQLTTAKSP